MEVVISKEQTNILLDAVNKALTHNKINLIPKVVEICKNEGIHKNIIKDIKDNLSNTPYNNDKFYKLSKIMSELKTVTNDCDRNTLVRDLVKNLEVFDGMTYIVYDELRDKLGIPVENSYSLSCKDKYGITRYALIIDENQDQNILDTIMLEYYRNEIDELRWKLHSIQNRINNINTNLINKKLFIADIYR